ncbi:GNAT superfamily N-acetyltransferase [Pseudorhizobium tarimense]|uniref:GNAT superfamily N-acetyltransferase n=1 Tax=Pseudorhizobium tarimense TaxID=1079109 RepID=A0ABV2H8L7_9HYPH|nr:GNAT family N-acetyltransferase [Pseudorhizobium tarimense]MCJ8520011.1 GNAT family N-acetyltransferase [Pseudorhizobium tarimense]
MTSPAVIRELTQDELGLLLEWARLEGWNPGLADAEPFHAADASGFLGCFNQEGMVAGISAVRYCQTYGFIGLYICHPDHRGKGFGKAIWEAGMDRLRGCTVGLDGVPEQQANYRRMGFETSYHTTRWTGQIVASKPVSGGCAAASPEILPQLLSYDASVFGKKRTAFLPSWLQEPRKAFVRRRGGAITGYTVLRRCHEGFKIGPLFADGLSDAEGLMAACARETKDQVLSIDVPETQTTFSHLLLTRGMSPGFTTARMYKGGKRSFDPRTFAITTLELG